MACLVDMLSQFALARELRDTHVASVGRLAVNVQKVTSHMRVRGENLRALWAQSRNLVVSHLLTRLLVFFLLYCYSSKDCVISRPLICVLKCSVITYS